MKRNTPEHWKTAQLMIELGIGLAQAVGHLELLFHLTAKQAPQGNIGKVPNEIIAQRCAWEGDPQTFISALVKAKWVEECAKSRLIVHDWHDHADDATKKALMRAGKDFLSKETFPVDINTEPQKTYESVWTTADNGGQRRTTADDVRLPSLAKPSLATPLANEPIIKFPVPDQSFLPPSLDTDEFRLIWQEWESYWSNLKGPMQPLTRCGQWAALSKLGVDEAMHRIRFTIDRGYRNLIVREKLDELPTGQVKQKPSLGANTEHEEKCRVANERKARIQREAAERDRQQDQESDRTRKAAVM